MKKKLKPLGKKKSAKGKAEAKAATKEGIKNAIPPFNRSWDDGDAAMAKRLGQVEPKQKAKDQAKKIRSFGG